MTWLDQVLAFIAERKDGLLVLSALLAAGASIVAAWVSARASRKNRRAELRERWISELRGDLSELLAMRVYRLGERQFGEQEIIRKVAEHSALQEKVILRLFEIKEGHKELLDAMDDYAELMKSNDPSNEKIDDVMARIRNCGRMIIRTEWKKAVRGK